MLKLSTLTVLLSCLVFALLPNQHVVAQDAGIFQTYVVLEVDTPGNIWLAGSENADGAEVFAGGTWQNVSALKIVGGEIKSWKNNGGDVTAASLHYRIVPSGTLAGDFTEVNLPFLEDLPNAGDQKWQTLTADIRLLDSLTPGTYDLELYWKIATNIGDIFDNNGGNNVLATFEVTSVSAPNGKHAGASMQVYPNPASAVANVRWQLPETMQRGTIRVLDVMGALQYQQSITAREGSMQLPASLAAGMYLVQLQGPAGEAFGVRQLVLR